MSDPQTASITDLTWERGRRCLKEIRERIEQGNKNWSAIVERWREYGLILLELRKQFPNNREFARMVNQIQLDVSPAESSATRSDAMWLAKLDDICFGLATKITTCTIDLSIKHDD